MADFILAWWCATIKYVQQKPWEGHIYRTITIFFLYINFITQNKLKHLTVRQHRCRKAQNYFKTSNANVHIFANLYVCCHHNVCILITVTFCSQLKKHISVFSITQNRTFVSYLYIVSWIITFPSFILKNLSPKLFFVSLS